MEAIPVSGGYPSVFGVDRDGEGAWLSTGDGRPGDSWDPVDHFVFVRPRK